MIGYIYLEWMIIFHLFNAKAWSMILELPFPDNEEHF